MLRESKYGSVSLFWNGLLISMFEREKKEKNRITYDDHYIFRKCLFALMRLGIVENNEHNGYFCMSKRRSPKRLRPEEKQV